MLLAMLLKTFSYFIKDLKTHVITWRIDSRIDPVDVPDLSLGDKSFFIHIHTKSSIYLIIKLGGNLFV